MAETARMRSVQAPERVPYPATELGAGYAGITRLPVSILLDNVRSLYNVGAFFRTADAAGVEKLYLTGFTASPPHRGLAKTALGAERIVRWERSEDPLATIDVLRRGGLEIAGVETSLRAVDLFNWQPRFPVCVVFGHEIDGVRPELLDRCDTLVRIPMLGRKHSLNVATAGGVVVYELLRKYRGMVEQGYGRGFSSPPPPPG